MYFTIMICCILELLNFGLTEMKFNMKHRVGNMYFAQPNNAYMKSLRSN